MATITKEELSETIRTESASTAKAVAKELLKAERKRAKKEAKKQAKKERKRAEKNANNGGDVTAEHLRGQVHGQHDASDVNAVPNGGNVESRFLNKDGSPLSKKDRKLLKSVNENLEKMGQRPRFGGPVLDGQARGAGVFPASEGRTVDGSAAKSGASVETLQKSFDEEVDTTKKVQVGQQLIDALQGQFDAAEDGSAIKMQLGEKLTLTRLKVGHEAKAI